MPRNSAYIQDLGSGRAVYAIVDANGAFQGPWTQLGIIASSQLVDDTPVKEINSEGAVYTSDDVRKITFKMSFLQRDLDTIRLAAKTLRGKRIAIIKEMNEEPVNGKHQYLGIAIGKVTPKLDLSLPTPRPELEVTLEKNSTPITFDLTSVSNQGFSAVMTGTLVIGANEYYEFKEI